MEKTGPPLEPPCTAHVVCSITGLSSTCTTADRMPEVTEGPQAWPKTPKPTTLTGSPGERGGEKLGTSTLRLLASYRFPSEILLIPFHTPGHLPQEPCRGITNSLCSLLHVPNQSPQGPGPHITLLQVLNKVSTWLSTWGVND